jgi:hypothetical protein
MNAERPIKDAIDSGHATSLNLKEFAWLIPIFGTAIAVAYDVGFFWGLDINYFTLFSVSEHIVFALEAMPIALGISFAIIFFFVAWRASDAKEEAMIEKAKSSLGQPELVEWAKAQIAKRRKQAILSIAFSVVYVILQMIFKYGWHSVWYAVIIGTAYSILGLRVSEIVHRRNFAICYFSIAALIVSFAVGDDVQREYVRGGKASHAVSFDGTELMGRVVRAGDRGILFFNPSTNEISLLRWDTIKRIRTLPQ